MSDVLNFLARAIHNIGLLLIFYERAQVFDMAASDRFALRA